MTERPPPSVIVQRNPLSPLAREQFEARDGELLIDWMAEHYPNGFGRPVQRLYVNGEPLELADADVVLRDGDVAQLLVGPGGTAFGTIVVTALVTAVISAAISLLLNYIIGRPKQPSALDTPGPDPIYSITGAQNAARIGEPVPVLYGRMITTPDFGSQPYSFFQDNDQYLDQILVIGWGEFTLHDVRVGETPVSALQSDAVEYWQFGPADHDQVMGTIETTTGVMENVVSSPEVADQELSGVATGGGVTEQVEHVRFTAPNLIEFIDYPPALGAVYVQVTGSERNNGNWTIASFAGTTITVTETTIRNETPDDNVTLRYFSSFDAFDVGPFITCKPGVQGNRIMADFVFPGGLYAIDASTGDLLNEAVNFSIDYQPVDDDGVPYGVWGSYPVEIIANTNTPLRRTYTFDVGPARYRVKVSRTSAPPANAQHVNSFVWSGLKFRLLPTAGAVYGETTLLVIRTKATNGIAAAASSRITADVTRKLPHLGTGPLLESTSPADAFVDVYTNPIYGAKRPLSELDLDELAMLEEHWAGEAHFNGGFAQKSTIWEALSIVVQTAAAAPLPLGHIMSIAQDGTRAIRTQLFSDANMVRGSLAIGYNFDKPGDYDGIRVEYRDRFTWNAAFATWPPTALDADLVQLFGCTDPDQAEGFARLLWQKRLKQRKTAHFETEREGLLPRLGDRIAVATQLPRWAAAGVVVRVDDTTSLLLDAPPDWSGTGHFVVLRSEAGEPSAPLAVSPGADPNAVVLAAPPPFQLFGVAQQEPTHYAFGNSTSLVADFIVSNIEDRGEQKVGIEALVYNPEVFADTLPWLEVPI